MEVRRHTYLPRIDVGQNTQKVFLYVLTFVIVVNVYVSHICKLTIE